MAYTLRRVCFAVPWLVVLGWVLSEGIENIEGALIVFLMVGMELAAAPTSFVIGFAVFVVERTAPGSLPAWLDPSSLIGKFLLLWTMMFALSYWQWFHLIPRIVRAFRRRGQRGDQTFSGSK